MTHAGIHSDCRWPNHRATVFADAAADTQPRVHVGEQLAPQLPVTPWDLALLQVYRLLRHRAHLLTDEALALPAPGDATVPLDGRHPDHLLALLFQPQGRDGLHRAHLPAGVAGIIAVTQAGHQHWRPEA